MSLFDSRFVGYLYAAVVASIQMGQAPTSVDSEPSSARSVAFRYYIDPMIDVYNIRDNLTTLELMSIFLNILSFSSGACKHHMGRILQNEDVNLLYGLISKIEQIYTYILDDRYDEFLDDCETHGNRLMVHIVECLNGIYSVVLLLGSYFSDPEMPKDCTLRLLKLSFYFYFRYCGFNSKIPQLKRTMKSDLPEQFIRKSIQIEGTDSDQFQVSSVFRCSLCNKIKTYEKSNFNYVGTCSHLVCRACVKKAFNKRGKSRYAL